MTKPKEFKVGDRVGRFGTVEWIDPSASDSYQLGIKWDDGSQSQFTLDGRYTAGRPRTLRHIKPKPPKKRVVTKTVDQLVCRRCEGASMTSGKGCIVCGGFGFIAQLETCPTCDRTGYFRPENHTVYEGKRYTSIDGLEIVWHESGRNCVYCEEGNSGV